MHRNTQ